jgi:SAM-dependent methyltransferase
VSIDWGLGHYERTAERLLPAAREVIDVAAPQPGERVLDVGCGTGNAALLAAERGAVVVGVDPAPRLLDVARARAAAAGRQIEFFAGDAAAPPVPAASFDAVVSVFAAVFAPDPDAALAGMLGALTPGGRIVMSAWIPGNAISRMNQLVMGATRAVTGAAPPAGGVAWHELDDVAAVAARHGLAVKMEERSIGFDDTSAEDYLAAELDQHPMALAARTVLEPAGRFDEVRRDALAILQEGNENPEGFHITSRYVILSLSPSKS